MARFAPTSDSTVRSIKSSRACTSTWIAHILRDALLLDEAAHELVLGVRGGGKPTSISLKPHFTRASNNSSFCATFIGTGSAWLPSRRSTLHQMGARREGAVRPLPVRQMDGGKGAILAADFGNHGMKRGMENLV